MYLITATSSYELKYYTMSVAVMSRGGTNPNVYEPESAKIALEPASNPSFLLIKMLKFEFEPIGTIGSPSLEPGAYLLRAKILARASEPEPRLVPPLVVSDDCDFNLKLSEVWQYIG